MKYLKNILAISAILSIIFIPFQTIASTIPITPALFETSMSFPEATTDTSFTLVSNALQNGILPNGYTCFTVDQGQPNVEYECGTVTGTAVTNVTRGIDPISGNTSNTNLIFSHRRGADVKITDFPTLTILSRILSQQDTIPQPITYANGVTPVAGQDLTTKAYVLSVVNGGPISYNQVIVSGTAGATIVQGNLIYLNVADGRWYPTTANTTTTIYQVQLGVAQGAGTTGNTIVNGVLIRGVDTNNTGIGGAYAYAGNTNGSIVSSAGANISVVGQYIVGSAGLYFDPLFYTSITPNQLGALAGNGGTPSSVNTYVTQQGFTTNYATNIQTFNANGTWTKPTGAQVVKVFAVAGGGGGGACATAGTNSNVILGGGAGGGSGEFTVPASTLSSSVAITVGAGGTGGIGSSNTAPIVGGNSSFGTLFTVYGGGTTVNETTSNAAGGGGGGGLKSAGSNGTTAGTGTGGGAGGNPLGAAAGVNDSTFGGGGGGEGSLTASATAGGGSVYGGGGGGGAQVSSIGLAGGSSIWGAGGGGGGAGFAGTPGAGGTSQFAGAGGAGGNNTAGSNGVAPGGGGGGAGSSSMSFKNGGNGAAGEIIVITYF